MQRPSADNLVGRNQNRPVEPSNPPSPTSTVPTPIEPLPIDASPIDSVERGGRIEQTLKMVSLIGLLVGCLLVLLPFVSAVLWAMVLCFTTWPVYEKLLATLRNKRALAALVMTLAIFVALVAPFAIMGASLTDDVKRATEAARESLAEGPPAPPAWLERIPLVGQWADDFWRGLMGGSAQRRAQLRQYLEPMREILLVVGVAVGRGVLELLLSLFIAFFLYRDGVAAAEKLRATVQRLGGEQGRTLLEIAGKTVRGVVYGILGTALAQSIVAGIGFAIAPVPQAAFWALMTFFLSILPVGPPLIWIPMAAWLFYKGWIGWGIFMIVWGILISSVDNVIKPLIISRGANLPFVLILMGVLGGAIAFGFIGVFLGPTLLAVGFRLLTWWTETRTGITKNG